MKFAYVKLGQVSKCYSSNCDPHNTSLTSKVNLSCLLFSSYRKKDDFKQKLAMDCPCQHAQPKLPFTAEA